FPLIFPPTFLSPKPPMRPPPTSAPLLGAFPRTTPRRSRGISYHAARRQIKTRRSRSRRKVVHTSFSFRGPNKEFTPSARPNTDGAPTKHHASRTARPRPTRGAVGRGPHRVFGGRCPLARVSIRGSSLGTDVQGLEPPLQRCVPLSRASPISPRRARPSAAPRRPHHVARTTSPAPRRP